MFGKLVDRYSDGKLSQAFGVQYLNTGRRHHIVNIFALEQEYHDLVAPVWHNLWFEDRDRAVLNPWYV